MAEEPAAPTVIEPIAYPAPDLLTEAARARLRAERIVMANELLAWPRLDPRAARRAADELRAAGPDTVQDNFRRFAKALAGVHPDFGKAHARHAEGKYAEAAGVLEPYQVEKRTQTGPPPEHLRMPPYSYSIAKMYYGECTGRVGNLLDAVLSYEITARHSGRNVTVGATALWRAAMLYEQTGRLHYALPLWKALARNFADLLCDAEVLRIQNKVARAVRYEDPYRLALGRAAESEVRLARGEAGPEAQAAQDALLQLLRRMMALPEEYPHWYEHCEAIMLGGTRSELRAGAPPADYGLLATPDPDMTGADDWGRLRPREKQELLQMFSETYPQRYRDMLEAYYRNISEAETDAARHPRPAPPGKD